MAEEGYEVPVHRSLTEKILIAGAPREIAILNGTLGAALGMGLHSFYALPLCIAFHLFAVAMTKRDPQFFDSFRRHIKQKQYYEV